MNEREKQERTWVFDLETTPESQYEKEGLVRTWLCYMSNRTGSINIMKQNINDMLDDLIRRAPKGVNIVLSHNGSHFDMEFMGHWLSNNFKPFNNKKEFITKNDINQFSFIITPNRIMEINLVIKDKQFKFRDSKMMFNLSVSQMEGILLGKKNHIKTDIDYDKEHYEKTILEIPKSEIDYMINDVEVVKNFITKMENELNEVLDKDEKFNMYDAGMTASSETMRRYKNHLAKEILSTYEYVNKPAHAVNIVKKIFKCDNDLWDSISLSYNGGMTYVNPLIREKIINKVVQYDVNSMYPAVMMNERLPYGPPLEINKQNINNKYTFKFYEIKLLSPINISEGYHPFLPFKNVDGVAEHVSTIDNINHPIIRLPEPLYKDFLKYYDVIEGLNIISRVEFIFKSKILFKSYMEKWEKIKIKGDFYKIFAKIMMNGLYGKWAQKRKMDGKTLVAIKDIIYTLSRTDLSNRARLGDFMLFDEVSTAENPFYIPIASAITGFARSLLVNGIQNNKERFLYCDTDSIHLSGHHKPKGIDIHDHKFGAWKKEWDADRGIYVRPKRYMVQLPNYKNIYYNFLFLYYKKYNYQFVNHDLKIVLAGFNQYRPASLEIFQNDCINGRKITSATKGRRKVRGGVIIKLKDKTLRGNSVNEVNVDAFSNII